MMYKGNFTITELEAGHLNGVNIDRLNEMLSQLRVSQLKQDIANALLTGMNNQGSKVFAAFDVDGDICGVLTLLLEVKLLSGGSVAGHIEDVATHPDSQKQGISSALTQHAIHYAQQMNIVLADDHNTTVTLRPYKIILDCSEELQGFYAAQGFVPSGVFMRKYLT